MLYIMLVLGEQSTENNIKPMAIYTKNLDAEILFKQSCFTNKYVYKNRPLNVALKSHKYI